MRGVQIDDIESEPALLRSFAYTDADFGIFHFGSDKHLKHRNRRRKPRLEMLERDRCIDESTIDLSVSRQMH